MVEEVIKKSGETEDFLPEKIIISAINAGTDYKKAKKIANRVKEKFNDQETVEASKIKLELIKELNNKEKILN